MNLLEQLRELTVADGTIGICWVGQAGFVIKDSQGRTLAWDLYITDCGENMKGFKRFSAKLLDPKEFVPDYYLITHSHFDHLDYEAIPVIASAKKTTFITTPSCSALLRDMKVSEEQICTLDYYESVSFDGLKVTAVEADHGDMVPDSFGFVIEFAGKRLYVTGDTCYRRDIFEKVSTMAPEIMVTCINGRFGNLDSEAAAKAALDTKVKVAIPCHFWTFMQHGGDPMAFTKAMEANPACKPLLFTQGEIRVL